MCLTFCKILSETFLILQTIQRDIITDVHRSSCKVPVTIVGFYSRREFVGLLVVYAVTVNKGFW